MKALAFTDVHASLEFIRKIEKKARKQKPDIMLCCGDVSVFGNGLRDVLDRINKLNIHCLMIHGNHEAVFEMKEALVGLENIEFIHNKHVIIGDHVFFGYGGGGLSENSPNLSTKHSIWKKIIKENSGKTVVLLTHAPPYGAVDIIYKEHCGNKTITEFIEKNDIDYCFCGHLHENEGKKQKLGKTKVINPGAEGMIIEL